MSEKTYYDIPDCTECSTNNTVTLVGELSNSSHGVLERVWVCRDCNVEFETDVRPKGDEQ